MTGVQTIIKHDFPTTSEETLAIAMQLVSHLRTHIEDSHGRCDWTTENLDALRSFSDSLHRYELKSYPPEGSNRKGAFLWDFVAYQQDTGILITAESEFDNHPGKLAEDFDKLLYAQSRIKLFIFRTEKDAAAIADIVARLTEHMSSCRAYSPAEVYILYCRRWKDESGQRGDFAWYQQVQGPPAYCDLSGAGFIEIPHKQLPATLT